MQGFPVFLAEAERVRDRESGPFNLFAQHLGDASIHREDMLLDKIGAAAVAVEKLVINGDRLDHRFAAWLRRSRSVRKYTGQYRSPTASYISSETT